MNIQESVKVGEHLTVCTGLFTCAASFLNEYAAAVGALVAILSLIFTQITNWYWRRKMWRLAKDKNTVVIMEEDEET